MCAICGVAEPWHPCHPCHRWHSSAPSLGPLLPLQAAAIDESSLSLRPFCGEAMTVWRWALAYPLRRSGGTRVLLADPELGWWGTARVPLEPAPERARTRGAGRSAGGAPGPERDRRCSTILARPAPARRSRTAEGGAMQIAPLLWQGQWSPHGACPCKLDPAARHDGTAHSETPLPSRVRAGPGRAGAADSQRREGTNTGQVAAPRVCWPVRHHHCSVTE